jgi:two-component system cell cycle sensor histidine kinase/response regulator CckA
VAPRAGGIAHDFNNLLTAILGFCDLLLVKHGPGDQSFADITQIKQNANRAANLVRQLLAFSRQQTLKPKVLNLTDVLAELSNLLRRLIGEKIGLSLQHGRDLGSVKVDEGQFEQVVINLCVNARDAMPEGGSITITTRDISRRDSEVISKRHKVMPVGDYVLLQIKDTGTGIPLKIQGKIFEPFFSTKEVGKGTGLGLSTVYGIVKQTGGFIFLDSEDNAGTTFNIYLPLYKKSKTIDVKPAEEAPKEKKRKDLTGRETLLLVEDEDAVRMFAVRALKNKGYNVLEADCGESAIELISELADDVMIDLVISDVVMPIMDGPTMIRKLKEDDPDLKVIFISGYAEDAFDSDLDGDFNFLPKPFSLTQLAEKVREVLSE